MGRHAHGQPYYPTHARLLRIGRRVQCLTGGVWLPCIIAAVLKSGRCIVFYGSETFAEKRWRTEVKITPDDRRGKHKQHPTRPRWQRFYLARRHPLADRSGYAYPHRIEAAARDGRRLRRREAIPTQGISGDRLE